MSSKEVGAPKAPESKALGIISIVFGALGLVMSWIPIVNNVAAIFAGIGIILGIIALLVNLHKTKLLAIIGTVLSVIAVGIVLVTQSMYSNAIDHATKSVSTSTESGSSKTKTSANLNQTHKWTEEEYNSLAVGDALTGQGGVSLKDIEAKYGKPNTSSQVTVNGMTVKQDGWTNIDGNFGSVVALQFVKQDDGSWLLSTKSTTDF
ncbi:hypothetical protein [Weissella halotolerans]|uniref:DUF4190 domain-containing protein n=1 Tax=Weissella halotolerans DSM 20190 TaxID=1123500 RepID=A0A0R2FZW7_9LACO|nr:hypothetical protein [Weissella halotolerans]KRN30796.1 hypothetical protein IV68_GL001223 [Weissella halotolerans DSM 20190]